MKKIIMIIAAFSALFSLSGCHDDPAYVDTYFQRQSVIEELSNELAGQYSSWFLPVVYKASGEKLDYKSLWRGELADNGRPVMYYTFGGYDNRTVTLQQVPVSWISFIINDPDLAEAVKQLPDYDISIPYFFASADEKREGVSRMGIIMYGDSNILNFSIWRIKIATSARNRQTHRRGISQIG